MSTFNRRNVFIIVPAYNEDSVLPRTVRDLLTTGHRVVVIDDGSTDDTAQIRHFPIDYVRHAVNLGQGAALQTGMTYALMHGAVAAVHFDADGQHDVTQIRKVLEPLEAGAADVVFGSRFLREEDRANVPRIKRVFLRLGIIVSGTLSGMWLSDTHNGFRGLSRKALECIQLRENGFAHATEILGQVRASKLRYTEVPVTVRYSDYSRAKGQSIWNSAAIVFDLLVSRLLG